MKKKIMLVFILAAAVICSLCGCSREKEESYRIIQVLEVSGTVSVERTDIGAMDVYEGMRLQSGDVISVGEESWLKFQMDEDKYALVEPDSKLRLEASGSSADSKTVIHLETGAISNRIEEKLSEGSTYEVNTPNSTMAVRGTVFRVEVTWDEKGVSITDISVYNGEVTSRLIYPDGSIDKESEAVSIAADEAVLVRGDNSTSVYVKMNDEADLNELKLKTLLFLKEAYETGEELGIPEEKLDALIQELEEEPERELEPETEPKTEEEPEQTEADDTESEDADENEEIKGPEKAEGSAAQTPPAEETPAPPVIETPVVPPVTETLVTPPPAAPPTPSAPSGSGSSSAPPTEETPSTPPAEETPSTPEPETPTTPEETTEYTVTFYFGNNVFATQTVKSGEAAVKPILMPAAEGKWDFDFETQITGNTTINWVAGVSE